MKKRLFVSMLLLAATTLGVQAQGTPTGSRSRKAKNTQTTTTVIDSASNASATDDGASGQSGRPMAIPSSTTAQATSVKKETRSSQKMKHNTRTRQQ